MSQSRKTTITKIIPIVLIVLYTALICAVVCLSDLKIDKAVIAFMTICSTMLLTDIGKTIKDTYNMADGDFKQIYTPYYISCGICSFALATVIVITQKTDTYSGEMNNLLASIGIVIAEYIGALLGNKLATGDANTSNSNNEIDGK